MLIVYDPVDSLAAEDIGSKEEDTLALPTGTPLVPGTIILVEKDWYLRIEAMPEPLIAVTPENSQDAIRLAFEIGNRHFPLAMEGSTLLVPDDPAMAQLFDRLGARWSRRQAIFSPLGVGLIHAR
jgi:urease accessory protein UreE